MPVDTKFNFRQGEVLLFDKPIGWSSFKVVYVVRKIIKAHTGEKMKVGHAGTLDPLATGLLIVCTGRSTKTISAIQDSVKEYVGTIRLGATTPTFDLESEVGRTFDTSNVTQEMVEKCAQDLTGEMLQTPPMYSAKKIEGKRAYENARKGIEVKMRQNLVTVNSFDIQSVDRIDGMLDVAFKVICSKGTYIRSLAHDMGALLSVGGHLTSLRRTRIGAHSVTNAIHPDDLRECIAERGFQPNSN